MYDSLIRAKILLRMFTRLRQNRIVKIIVLCLFIALLLFGSYYFITKELNRRTAPQKISAINFISGYSMMFHPTSAFSDFLFDRGFWNGNGVKISGKGYTGTHYTVKSIRIVLSKRAFITQLTRPILTQSSISTKNSQKDPQNTYVLSVLVDPEGIKTYFDQKLAKDIFSAMLSQIYEDTSSQKDSRSQQLAKNDYIAHLTADAKANPLILSKR